MLLFDLRGGRATARLRGHTGVVNALAFNRGGEILAAAGGRPGQTGEIRFWDVAARKLVRSLAPHADAIYSVAFSPDGALVAAASYDKRVSLAPVREDEPKLLKDHTDAVYGVAFSPDGSRVASASGDRTVKVWDVASGERLYTLSEATAELYTVAYRPDGKQLAAGGVDKMVRTWDVNATGGRLEQSAFAHDGAILRLLYTPDGRTLVTTGEDRSVRVWDAERLTERFHLDRQRDWPLAIALDRNGRQLAVGRYDGSVTFYSMEDGRRLRQLLR